MKTNRIILGIETSCDDTSVAIIKETDKKVIILSHLKYTQDQELKKWGGVVPEIAARNHLLKITPLLKQSFAQAKLEASQIDLIAVTTTPGLLGPLLTGLNAAKSLSLLHKTPILPVNHLYAHVQAIH
ncbi:MAG: tRNA (adenosine(37)-N6)-threonylcarbamoyltransferase complex transferase subunit TsaD, partial [Halobacteriovoraceae bacterium]|nr:tRNA (adenosine(37)-N6)-threonylcarbamoyltransferase complex transferase subunit TsaD [Halobacteriovoraceae bacterium]